MMATEDLSRRQRNLSVTSSSNDVLKGFHYCDNGPNFIDDADLAYIILLNVFRFLSVRDLLSAARVCKVWNLIASDNIFWKRVNLKNCTLQDINKMGQTLKKYGTEMVDLRDMSIPFLTLLFDDDWLDLCKSLINITTLTEINIAGCPASAVTLLVKGVPQLKSLSASSISGDSLDITHLKTMRDLRELKLLNIGSKTIIFDYSSSENIPSEELKLTTLTINRVINLSQIESILPTTLVSLALGEYQSLSNSFHEVILPKLVNLTMLRLEKCINGDLTTKLLEKIPTLSNLTELELINFEISNGFQYAIITCSNLKSLLLIPIYRANLFKVHMITNMLIICGVSKLKNSLQKFVWVVSDGLIKETNKLKERGSSSMIRVIGHGDSIPVLMPGDARIPFHSRINIVPLDTLQSHQALWPNLQFKILKVPFLSTWKLSLHNIKM